MRKTLLISMLLYTCFLYPQDWKSKYVGIIKDTQIIKGKTYIEVYTGTVYKRNYGLCDSNGNEIIPCKYKHLLPTEQYIKLCNTENKYGIADYSGQIILDCIATYIKFNSNETIGFYNIGGKKTGSWGTMGGKEGIIASNPLRILTAAKYDGTDVLFNRAKQSDSESYVKVNIGGSYDELVCLGGKWGVVDSNGKEIIKPQYTEIHLATENLFTFNEGGKNVKTDARNTTTEGGKWGVIDNIGNVVIPCQYDEPIYFKSDVAMVKKDGEVKLVKNPLVRDAAVSIAENTVVSYKKDLSGPAISRYPAPDSEVDKDIPQANKENENTFAFVVANENYPDAPVPYALNDGRMFANYCEKALGIPKKNINQYEDATYGSIISMVDKMKSIAKAYEGDATFVIYYAGHGFPDEKQSTAYLLPVDGSGSEITTTGYSLSHLYDELSKMPLKDAVVFLDACFSGAKREDDMLAQSRGVAIKVKSEQPKGNLLVFSASQGDETAHQMEEKHHGLFTYFLLKGLQQFKSNTNLGDLTDYVTKNVKRQSVVINNKKQTPTVIPSLTISSTWRSIQLSK